MLQKTCAPAATYIRSTYICNAYVHIMSKIHKANIYVTYLLNMQHICCLYVITGWAMLHVSIYLSVYYSIYLSMTTSQQRVSYSTHEDMYRYFLKLLQSFYLNTNKEMYVCVCIIQYSWDDSQYQICSFVKKSLEGSHVFLIIFYQRCSHLDWLQKASKLDYCFLTSTSISPVAVST